MRYIYRQIYNLKGKRFCLNKIRFLQTSSHKALCPHASRCCLPLMCVRWTRADPALHSAWSTMLTGVTTEPIPCPPALSFFFSFIVIIFVFLSVGQGCTRPDLSVAVKPFFYHLRDQGVVSPPRAFLHGNQYSALSHAAVQPLPEQFFLLFLIT